MCSMFHVTSIASIFLRYDRAADILIPVEGNQDPTLAANTARIATFCRAASENFHAPLKNTYKHLQGRAHNSRLNSVGQDVLDYYNRLFERNYGAEWAESPLLLVEYLVTVAQYNQHHPKFLRYDCRLRRPTFRYFVYSLMTSLLLVDTMASHWWTLMRHEMSILIWLVH